MAEVKWIKLNVDMFDDEKIKIIQAMPDGDAILVIWIKLITLAGKTNDGGYIYISDNIPYTDEMLSIIMNKPIMTIRLAMETFANLQMLESDTKGIYLVNFEKHQSLEKMELIKKQTRERVAALRERKKQDLLNASNAECNANVTLSVTQNVTQCNATDIDKEKEEEKDKNNIIESPKKETRHKYGTYNNVLLSDTDLEKLKTEFPDYKERIERLSEYIASSGKSYKNHLATIRVWAKKDKQQTSYGKRTAEEKNNGFCFNPNEDDLNDLF